MGRILAVFFYLLAFLVVAVKIFLFFYDPITPIPWESGKSRAPVKAGLKPLQLYDSILGYQSRPFHVLEDSGFSEAVAVPRGAKLLNWLDGATPPTFEAGYLEQTDIRDTVRGLCAYAAPGALIVFEIHWPLFENLAASPPVSATQAAMNRRNFARVLRWAYAEVHATDSSCVIKKVHFGTHGSFPIMDWWNTFQASTIAKGAAGYDAMAKTYQRVREQNDELKKLVLSSVDFLSPSLFAPYASDKDAMLAPRSHSDFWYYGANDVLSYCLSLKKPVIPFLGMRYYDDAESSFRGHFIEPGFFALMLETVASPQYGNQGVVYWDLGTYGGPGALADGTNVWRSNYPWYVTTESFFGLKIEAAQGRSGHN